MESVTFCAKCQRWTNAKLRPILSGFWCSDASWTVCVTQTAALRFLARNVTRLNITPTSIGLLHFVGSSQCAKYRFPRDDVHQACTPQEARRAVLSTLICRGPQKTASPRCVDFVVVWKKFWNDNYFFEIELLQHFLRLCKLSRPAGRMLCTVQAWCTPIIVY